MWRMHDADRALSEAEWAVFRLGLEPLADAVADDLAYDTDDAATGVPAFDRLTAGQKLALLADVTSALRDPASPTPPHTAAGEGAIAAVFAALRDELDVELDESDGASGRADRTHVRRRLRAVAAEYRPGAGKLPPPTRGGRRVWAAIVEAFEGRVFWDYDYELGDEFLDLPPDEARVRLRLAGIPADYFLATPADPGDRGLVAARQALAGLLGRPAPDDAGLYPALLDRYHDLFVGPVTPGEVAAWGDHPWVEVVGLADPGWDCDYPTWRAAFGGAVPAAPFRLDPAAPNDPGDAEERFVAKKGTRMTAEEARVKLKSFSSPAAAKAATRFFKTGPGQYGEGDTLIGVNVPTPRTASREFRALPLDEVQSLLNSPIHEERHLVPMVLVLQAAKGDAAGRKRAFDFYLGNTRFVNNWDLVDGSAPQVVGGFLMTRPRGPLHGLARSNGLWDRRIAIVSTLHFIRHGDLGETLAVGRKLLGDREDLIHKATGWMLREVGERDQAALEGFLDRHLADMPRTTLRYAIERFPPDRRRAYLRTKYPSSEGVADAL